ncbi:MAG: hypothetical protein ACYC9O_08490, partial [Candidatus Latescibacterota bacterium]
MESLPPIVAALIGFLWESSWRIIPLFGMALLVERVCFRESPLFRYFLWCMALLIPVLPPDAISSVFAWMLP